MTNKARQIVFTDMGTEALNEIREITGLNNSQAIATALKIAKIVLDAQKEGSNLVIENDKKMTKTTIKVVA